MKMQVAQTKLVPPRRRPDLVSRLRLHALLDTIIDCRLYLVIAPAGYGKTTLLADWARQASMRVCWYQVATMDQNSHQFYAHFVATLRSQFASFGSDSTAALNSLVAGQGSTVQFLTTVVNDLYDHVEEEFALVIDDYHLVDKEEEIIHFVSQFVQYAPDTCHVVLSSRTLTSLPDLDLLVARGHVRGLGHEELAFTPDEIQTLALQHFKHHLEPKQAEALAELSEGWITGLLLSAHAQGWRDNDQLRVLKASGVDLYSYFAQQVLDKQVPALRDFLLRTSLMEEFDAEFCAYVLGADSSVAGEEWSTLLDLARQNNLFVSETSLHTRRLRYHSLFQEFLRQRFVRENPAEASALLQRLAAVYAERQQWDQAYQSYRLLGDTQAQIVFLETFGLPMLNAGRSQLLVRWVEELPYSVQSEHGNLMTAYGKALVLTGESQHGIHVLNQAEAVIRLRNDPVALIRVLAYRSTAWRLVGRYQDSLEDAEQASQIAETLEQTESDAQDSMAVCLRSKGLAQYMLGQVEQGVAWLQKALSAFQVLGHAQETSIILMDVGLAHLNAGNYREALSLFEQALPELRRSHNIAGQAHVLNNLGYLHSMRGDYQAATIALREGLICAQKSGCKRVEASILATLADILDEFGMAAAAKATYELAAAVAEEIGERFLILYIQLARTRTAWLLDDWEAAFGYLDTAEQLVRENDSLLERSLYRLTMGRYYLARRRPDLALAPLQSAVEQFVNSGQVLDMARGQLFLAAATSHSDPLAARQILEQVLGSVQLSNNRHLLVVTGRCIRSDLERLAALAEGNTAITQFLADIDQFASSLPGLRRAAQDQLSEWLPISVESSPSLVICALGNPEVFVKGKVIGNADWVTLQARDMFFCLLAHPRGLTKEKIGLLLWPDCSSSQLKTRFKNTIHRMRNALPEETITFADDIYRFNRQSDYTYDVEEFLRRVDEAKKASDIAVKLRALKAAFELYRGPYLPTEEGLWAESRREALRQTYIEVGLELSSQYLESDQASEAIAFCLRVLSEDPCLEDAHRLAMRIHAASGNRVAIVNQYEQCRRVIAAEIDVEPSPQTVGLFESLMG